MAHVDSATFRSSTKAEGGWAASDWALRRGWVRRGGRRAGDEKGRSQHSRAEREASPSHTRAGDKLFPHFMAR